LYRIAVNESLHVQQKRRPVQEIRDDEPDDGPGPDALVEGGQTVKAIEDALMRIKPELRAVIVLRHVLNLSYEDMGIVLELPEKTVKSRLYSARQLLRERLLQRETI